MPIARPRSHLPATGTVLLLLLSLGVVAGCRHHRDADRPEPTRVDTIPGIDSLEIDDVIVRLRQDMTRRDRKSIALVNGATFSVTELRRGGQFDVTEGDRLDRYEIVLVDGRAVVLKQQTIIDRTMSGEGHKISDRIIRVSEYKPRLRLPE